MCGIFLSMRGLLSVGCSFVVLASLVVPHAEAKVSVAWRVIENRPDNRFQAELTLRNDGGNPLPQQWSLYFNSSCRLLPESVAAPFVLSHVNGDFYVLRPDKDCPPIGSDEERIVRWLGTPWAINVSDAPSGFYIVLADESGVELPPVSVPIEVGPFPDAEFIRRGAGDQLPVVTPASRYDANQRLTLLPADELPPVVPTPVRATALSGRVTIDRSTNIVYDRPLEAEARFLATTLQQSFDLNVDVIAEPNDRQGAIRLTLGSVGIDGAYVLTARPNAGIEIIGSTPAGVFYGIQTLRALLPVEAYRKRDKQLTIAAIQIDDAPRFRYRGLHLDTARNFQSVNTVKKLLDLMAFYKLNRFHWHLTDDEGWRIEIRSLPELTAVGGRRGHTTDEAEYLIPSLGSGPFPDPERSPGCGYYSQDDLIDILRFARQRHITVIPELDFPGHCASGDQGHGRSCAEGNGRRPVGGGRRFPVDRSGRRIEVRIGADVAGQRRRRGSGIDISVSGRGDRGTGRRVSPRRRAARMCPSRRRRGAQGGVGSVAGVPVHRHGRYAHDSRPAVGTSFS